MIVTTKGRKALLFGGVAAGSLLLAACGGGGGDEPSVTYTGVTTAAVIDETTAPVLAESAISSTSMDTSAALSIAGVQVASDVSPVEQLRTVADMAKRLAVTLEGTQTLAGVTYSGEPLAACSGSATASGSIDDVTFMPYSMSVSFSNYVEDLSFSGDGSLCASEQLNGSMSVTFSYDIYQQMNGMSFTLSNFSVTELTSGQSQAFNGTMSLTLDNVTYESSFSMTMDFRGIDGVVYRTENYTLEVNGIGELSSISGRLYDPAYGYIDLSTPTLFGYNGCYGGYPFSGVLRIDGANGGYVEIDANTGLCNTYWLTWSDGVAAAVTSVGYWY